VKGAEEVIGVLEGVAVSQIAALVSVGFGRDDLAHVVGNCLLECADLVFVGDDVHLSVWQQGGNPL